MATAGTAATAIPERRVSSAALWRSLFWLTAIANAVPLLMVRYAPFTDLPEHVAAMATIARLLPGGGGAPYVVALRESQYLLYHVVGALLTRLLGDAVLANQLLLVVVAIAWSLSTRALLRAFGRDERLALFAPMVFWSRPLLIGFLPFVAAVPLALFALARVVEIARKPTLRRFAGLAALSLALFYTHVSAFLVFLVTAAGVMVATFVAARRLDRRALATVLGALAPGGVAAIVWWTAGSLSGASGETDVARMGPLAALDAMPIWSFDLWASHVDELAAAAWWIAFAVLVIRGEKRDASAPLPLDRLVPLVPLACAAAIYLVTPFRVGAAAYLNLRLAPIVVLFALLLLRPPKVGTPATLRLVSVALTLGGAASLLMAASATFEMRRLSREMVGDLDALLAEMAPSTRVALVNFEVTSKRTNAWPYVFAGSFHRARGGAMASYSFTELPHWPVHYAPGAEPPAHGPFWSYRPCAYRMNIDGAFYDYVLVQGDPSRFVETSSTNGPPFLLVSEQGIFHLFAKAHGPPPDMPERSVCRRRPRDGASAP